MRWDNSFQDPEFLLARPLALWLLCREQLLPPHPSLFVSSLCVSPPSILRRKRVGSVRTPLGDREVLGGSSEVRWCKWRETEKKVGASVVILWWLQARWGCSPCCWGWKICLLVFAVEILPFLKYPMLPGQRFLILKSIPLPLFLSSQ